MHIEHRQTTEQDVKSMRSYGTEAIQHGKRVCLLLTALTIIALMLCMSPSDPSDAISEPTDTITWALDDGTLTISHTGTGGTMPDYGDGAAPWYQQRDGITAIVIDDKVTSIGDYAFRNCQDVTSVTISDTVTSIGIYAFKDCKSLSSITIPNNVTTIDSGTFENCIELSSVTIGSNVTSIGSDAFRNCLVSNGVIIPNSVTTIGANAFKECKGLTSIDTKNVESIGNNAFENCINLSSVTIGKGTIDFYAFHGCTALSTLNIKNGVTIIKEGAFLGCTSLDSLSIPNSVTSICSRAFEGCTSLGSLTIGSNVADIRSAAFKGCTSLDSVEIPGNVRTIGTQAFDGCTSLDSLIFGEGVTSINTAAFQGCISLISVAIPNSVTSIQSEAFDSCTYLSTMTIGDGLESISYSAFRNCTSLCSITLPSSGYSIGSEAFKNTQISTVILSGESGIEEHIAPFSSLWDWSLPGLGIGAIDTIIIDTHDMINLSPVCNYNGNTKSSKSIVLTANATSIIGSNILSSEDGTTMSENTSYRYNGSGWIADQTSDCRLITSGYLDYDSPSFALMDGVGKTFGFNQPTRIGYTFTGYYTDDTNKKVIDATGNLIPNVSGYTDASGNWIKETFVLSPGWVKTQYRLFFDYYVESVRINGNNVSSGTSIVMDDVIYVEWRYNYTVVGVNNATASNGSYIANGKGDVTIFTKNEENVISAPCNSEGAATIPSGYDTEATGLSFNNGESMSVFIERTESAKTVLDMNGVTQAVSVSLVPSVITDAFELDVFVGGEKPAASLNVAVMIPYDSSKGTPSVSRLNDDGTLDSRQTLNVTENTITFMTPTTSTYIIVYTSIQNVNTVTVILNPNGGSLSSETLNISSGTYGNLPTPNRSGYEFDGWYYLGQEISSGTSLVSNQDHTLTAYWTMIVDDYDEPSGTDNTIEVAVASAITIIAVTLAMLALFVIKGKD